MSLVFSSHALERFREHVPDATEGDAIQYLQGSEPIDPELVAALTQAPKRAKSKDEYYLCKTKSDAWGIWVLEDVTFVRTYLRLGVAHIRVYELGQLRLADEFKLEPEFDPETGNWNTQIGTFWIQVHRRPLGLGGAQYHWVLRPIAGKSLATGTSPHLTVALAALEASLLALVDVPASELSTTADGEAP